MQTRGEGVKNPENFADVICTWPLRDIIGVSINYPGQLVELSRDFVGQHDVVPVVVVRRIVVLRGSTPLMMLMVAVVMLLLLLTGGGGG